MIRTYSELKKFVTFEERYKYLRLAGSVGQATFGFDRYLNQMFYTSRAWRQIRDSVIVRDDGCDLGIPGYEIHDYLLVHHINPIKITDLEDYDDKILNPEYLICVSKRTHQAIHYGDDSLLPKPFVKRHPGDTKLW